MSRQIAGRQRFAVLIGIDFYHEKPLEGSVRDVDMIQKCLTETHITRLTASGPIDADTIQPPEDPSLWPTLKNLTACLSQIQLLSSAGDHIYIHYSGHGTRTPRGELALAFLDGGNIGDVDSLSGLNLARIINQMAKQRLKVTLVLDCCFSGALVRSESQTEVRYIECNSTIEVEDSITCHDTEEPTIDAFRTRDASMLANWLINTDSYTILTACGPHEEAREVVFENGVRQGALSYFLSRILQKPGTLGMRHYSIYRLLCSRFHALYPQQNPMFFGNENLGFFGDLDISPRFHFVPAYQMDDGTFYLEEGRAHGASDGDVYALYPRYASEWRCDISKTESIKARIHRAFAVTSELELDGEVPTVMKSRCKAVRLGAFSLAKVPILLKASASQFDWSVQAIDQSRSFELLSSAAQDTPFMFKVGVNDCGRLEIQDQNNKKIHGLPTLPCAGSEQAIEQVMNVIEHLTRFKQIESMENNLSKGASEDMVEIRLGRSSGESFDRASLIEAKHDEDLHLIIHNKCDKAVYLHVYNLKPSWEIKNILKSDYATLPAKNGRTLGFGAERKRFTLTMKVPAWMIESGQLWCSEVVKVFITLQPSSFAGLAQGVPILRSEGQWEEYNVKGSSTECKTPMQKPNEITNDWIARNFHIRTILGNELRQVNTLTDPQYAETRTV